MDVCIKRKKYIEHRKKGVTNKEACRLIGMSESSGSVLFGRYQKEGESAFYVKPRGPKRGTRGKLSLEQENAALEALLNSKPMDHGLEMSFWSREIFKEFIEKYFQTEIALRTISDYFKKWGISLNFEYYINLEQFSEQLKKANKSTCFLSKKKRGFDYYYCFNCLRCSNENKKIKKEYTVIISGKEKTYISFKRDNINNDIVILLKNILLKKECKILFVSFDHESIDCVEFKRFEKYFKFKDRFEFLFLD